MGIIIILIISVIFFIAATKTPVIPKSRWSHHFDRFQFSAQDFYKQVEETIKYRQLPNVSFSRTTSPETNIFSTRREYLTVTRGEYIFDICAAPFGTGFFVSWWLGEREAGIWERIPIINRLPGRRRNKTYYQIDTETMFRSAIHNIVLSVIDGIGTSKGIRPLTELERQPKENK